MRRSINFAHLGLEYEGDDGSYSDLIALLVMYPRTKTLGGASCTGAFRHKNWDLCFISHLAMYLLIRLDKKVRVYVYVLICVCPHLDHTSAHKPHPLPLHSGLV